MRFSVRIEERGEKVWEVQFVFGPKKTLEDAKKLAMECIKEFQDMDWEVDFLN